MHSLIPLTPLKISCQIYLVPLLPELLDRFVFARLGVGLVDCKDGCGEGGVYLLVGSIVRDVAEVAVGGLKGSYVKDVWSLNQGLSASAGSLVKTDQETE